jgi:hypothetical protein
MPEPADCPAVEAVLQRALVGLRVSEAEVDEALQHVAACERCRLRFEVGRVRSYAGRDSDLPEEEEIRVEPSELFERALTAALGSPEAITRARAAAALADRARLGSETLAALAKASVADPDEDVRLAAARTLGSALGRLGTRPLEGLTRLAGALARAAGEVGVEGSELWLRLAGLPPDFEGTKPVVVLPDEPRVVESAHPVAGGRVDVSLGNVLDPAERRREVAKLGRQVAAQIYVVKREGV